MRNWTKKCQISLLVEVLQALAQRSASIRERSGIAVKPGKSDCRAGRQEQNDHARRIQRHSRAKKSCGFWTPYARSGSATLHLPKCSTRCWTKVTTFAVSGRCTVCWRITASCVNVAGAGTVGVASRVSRPATRSHGTQPVLELGHHEASWTRPRCLLLPLYRHGHLQSGGFALRAQARRGGGLGRGRARIGAHCS